jgi:hypothetical protein
MTTYQIDALNLLSQLQQLKSKIKYLESESKQVQQQLAVAFAAGDLNDYKDPDQPNTIRHDDNVYVQDESLMISHHALMLLKKSVL